MKQANAGSEKPSRETGKRGGSKLMWVIVGISVLGLLGWMGIDLLIEQRQALARDSGGSTYTLPIKSQQLTVRIVPLVPSEAVRAQLPVSKSEVRQTAAELVSAEGLSAAQSALMELCPFSYEITDPVVIPDEFFAAERQQFNTIQLLDWLAKKHQPTSFRTIGVLAEDVYAPGYNYLFGQARLGGSICVASSQRMGGEVALSRLTPEERWHSILRHEFGHTLGLTHSDEKGSVMVYGNSLSELDRQGVEFTRRDWARLGELHPIDWGR